MCDKVEERALNDILYYDISSLYFYENPPMKSRYILVVFALLSLVSCRSKGEPIVVEGDSKNKTEQRLLKYGSEALRFIDQKGYSKDFCILIDFSVSSGKNRFFVYDPVNHLILDQGLTSHGTCTGPGLPANEQGAAYSNAVDSHCSSLGKYKIGDRGPSGWGIGVKYWLHGLESGNSNAARRAVVLHSWSVIPDFESFPIPTARSWGCPAISDNFMRRLDKRIKATNKPVLLWIYD
jgi:hypothetical protein